MGLREKAFLNFKIKTNRSNLKILVEGSLTDVHQLIIFNPLFQFKPQNEKKIFLRGIDSIAVFGMIVLD